MHFLLLGCSTNSLGFSCLLVLYPLVKDWLFTINAFKLFSINILKYIEVNWASIILAPPTRYIFGFNTRLFGKQQQIFPFL